MYILDEPEPAEAVLRDCTPSVAQRITGEGLEAKAAAAGSLSLSSPSADPGRQYAWTQPIARLLNRVLCARRPSESVKFATTMSAIKSTDTTDCRD